jgi:hypothetical protein
VVGYNSGASPGLIRLSKPHDFPWGFFVATFDFTTFDFWPFIAVKTGDSVKKSRKVAKNCDILPTSSIFQEKFPISGTDPGRGAALRVAFVRCVLCRASGGQFPAFPALVVSL